MTAPLRECGAASRALRTVLIRSKARDRVPSRPGPVPLEVGDALGSVRKRLRRLQQLLPEAKVLAADWEES